MATKLDPALILQERLQVNRLQMGLGEALSQAELDKIARELKRRLGRATGVDTVVDLYALALLGLRGLLGAAKNLRGAYLASLEEFAEIALTQLAQRASAATSQKLRLHVGSWQVEDAFGRGRFDDAALLGANLWRQAESDSGPARNAFGLIHARSLLRCGFVESGMTVLASMADAPAKFKVEAALLEAASLRARGLLTEAVETLRRSPLERLEKTSNLLLEAGFSQALSASLQATDYRPLVTFCRQNAQCPPDLLCLARLKLHGDREKGALTMLPKGATLSRKTPGPARTAHRVGRMVVAVDRLYDKQTELEDRLAAARRTLVAAARLPSIDEESLTKAAVYRWLLRAKAVALAAIAKDMIVATGLRYSGGTAKDPYGTL